nr:hypothetical protein [Tanacetum cinerariifolium]
TFTNLLYDNSSPRPSKELNAEIVDTIIESIPSLPIPVQDGNSQREEIDIVTKTDDALPPSVENDDDSEEDIRFLEAFFLTLSHLILRIIRRFHNLLRNHRMLSLSSKPDVIAEEISIKLNEDECFDPGGEIVVSTKVEDDNCVPFIFDIRFILPYLIFPEVSPLPLLAKSEDTIFDYGISD